MPRQLPHSDRGDHRELQTDDAMEIGNHHGIIDVLIQYVYILCVYIYINIHTCMGCVYI